MAQSDGKHYLEIAERGYGWPLVSRAIVFFPGYPSLVRWVAGTGLPYEGSAVIVSQVCWILSVVFLLDQFLATSRPTPEAAARHLPWLYCFWPTTFFFRMAYSEAVFLVLVLSAMWLLQSRKHPLLVAVVAGAATGVRPVGVALLLPLAHWLGVSAPTRTQALVRMAYCLPVAVWGLGAFMAYQYQVYRDPWLFSTTQAQWVTRENPPGPEFVLALATLEPFWSVYLPSSPGFWAATDPLPIAAINLQFANPLWVALTVGLVGYGAYRKWLTRSEILLAMGLLAIPYVTHAYRGAMWGQGRYAAVVYPAYFVAAGLLASAPRWVAVLVYVVGAVLMAAYTAQFAAGYRVV